jgi:hypothetical protein
MLSVYYDAAPVTEYSPAVFDAFVNQTKVSLSSRLPHPGTDCEFVLSSGVRGFMLKTKTHPWSRHLSPSARTCSHTGTGLHIHPTAHRLSTLLPSRLNGPTPRSITRRPLRYAMSQKRSKLLLSRMDRTFLMRRNM